ncbi:MAG: PaaI family thioesterase [Candidatus Dormiibacterota bacterium]
MPDSQATRAAADGSSAVERRRTIIWQDPAALAEAAGGRSGLEFVRAMRDGELPPPPIAELMQFTVAEVGPGVAGFRCAPGEWAYNPIGVVHGGLVCTLLDSAIGCAVQTTLEAGFGYTSIDLKVDYLRAVTRDSGPLVATGRVTKPGRRVAFASAEVVDRVGKLVATGSGSCLVMSRS